MAWTFNSYLFCALLPRSGLRPRHHTAVRPRRPWGTFLPRQCNPLHESLLNLALPWWSSRYGLDTVISTTIPVRNISCSMLLRVMLLR